MDFETRVAEAKRAIRAASIDGVQRRSVPFTVEVRASGDGGSYEIVGHAAVFNELSENLGGFREKIDPGAFAKVLAGTGAADARALFNHDPNLVLASRRNDTLHLAEDEEGLAYRAEVPAGLYYGEALRILLERGDVDQSSFAFRIARDGDSWEEDEETGGLIRTIREFSALYDVSPVTYPAYPQTDAASREAMAPPLNLEALREWAALNTPSPDEEQEAERAAASAASTAEPGEADGASEGLSLAHVKRDLAARERLLAA